jgi:hypothetical protein
MLVNEIEVLKLDYRGELEHGLPASTNMEATIGPIHLHLEQIMKLYRDHGKMQMHLVVSDAYREIIKTDISSKVHMSKTNGVTFQKLTTTLHVFPVEIVLNAIYGNIDPGSKSFISDFNNNTSIEIFSEEKHNKIGDMLLMDRQNHDKLNLAIIYSDGGHQFLEDFLLSFDAILNVKKN